MKRRDLKLFEGRTVEHIQKFSNACIIYFTDGTELGFFAGTDDRVLAFSKEELLSCEFSDY